MSVLLGYGACSYNGIDLSAAETLTTGIVSRPIPDSSGRTVKYCELALSIKSKVYADPNVGTTDAAMQSIRRQLSAYAGPFIYSNRGIGDIRVNVPGEVSRDVNYGPKPRMIKMVPIGNAYAWDLDYEIVVCIPECSLAKFQKFLMEACFDLSFDVDASGWTKRVFNGHIEIPTTRLNPGNPNLQDNADAYLNRILPSGLNGFKRTVNRKLNEAKTRLDVTVTDEEMGENIPPPGIVSIEADHSFGNTERFNINSWQGVMSADYELQKGTDPIVAKNHFLNWFEDRRNAIMVSALFKKTPLFPTGGIIMPTNFMATESGVFGKRHAKFTINFIVTVTSRTMMTESLWRPVPGGNWELWANSMASFNVPPGIAGLVFSNNQDAIIDLCSSAGFSPVQKKDTFLKRGIRKQGLPGPLSDIGSLLSVGVVGGGLAAIGSQFQSAPDPESSWLAYKNAIHLEMYQSGIVHKILISQPQTTPFGKATLDDGGGYKPISLRNLPQDIFQKRTNSSGIVILTGHGVRAGYPITPPVLRSVGGFQAIPLDGPGTGFQQALVGNSGFPVYAATWRLRYAVLDTPAIVPVPPVPIVGEENQLAPQGGATPEQKKRNRNLLDM